MSSAIWSRRATARRREIRSLSIWALPSLTGESGPWPPLGGPKNAGDGAGELVPAFLLGLELAATRASQLRELRALVVLRKPPLGADPPPPLDPVERRIERAFLNAQHVVRHLHDPLPDPEPVQRPDRDGLEDQHVERALQK